MKIVLVEFNSGDTVEARAFKDIVSFWAWVEDDLRYCDDESGLIKLRDQAKDQIKLGWDKLELTDDFREFNVYINYGVM